MRVAHPLRVFEVPDMPAVAATTQSARRLRRVRGPVVAETLVSHLERPAAQRLAGGSQALSRDRQGRL